MEGNWILLGLDREGVIAVLTRLLQALEIIAGQTTNEGRRQLLRQQADLIAGMGERTIPSLPDRAGIDAVRSRLSRVLPMEKRSKP